jgi:D-alanyl-lipoteichoic acid acyltransferase DltB (MBOAT superfamily)
VDTNWFKQLIQDNFSADALKYFFSYSLKEPWFFTEFSFLFVFGIFLLVYAFVVKHHFWKKLYVIAFSLFFYYKSSGPFLLLFVLMILSDYYFASLIHKKEGKWKKVYLWLALSYSLSFLLYFKYANFFIQNFNSLLGTNFSEHNLFLPIGISFYTFQSISYIIDVYRNEIKPCENFSDYTFYMTFLPHLVAGPIVRAKDFLPQIQTPQLLNASLYKEAMLRIIIGLIKKLFIADYLSKYVDMIHETPKIYSGAENLISMYAYSFQIYFDFSGYSDIAIGIALILGYRLKENFENPYQSFNISDFWRKWHISLSNWLRDYIYIPLGGNRKGLLFMYLFLFLTMLIGGFWHGASWRFVVWGIAHGIALILHKIWMKKFPSTNKNIFFSGLGLLLTFNFVALCWIFFRAYSFESAFVSITKIFTSFTFYDLPGFWYSRTEFCYILIIATIVVFTPSTLKEKFFATMQKLPVFAWIFIMIFVFQLIIQFKDEIVQPFIYFQF